MVRRVTLLVIATASCGRVGFESFDVGGVDDARVDEAVTMPDVRVGPVSDYLARCPMDELMPDGTIPCEGGTATCADCPTVTAGRIAGAYTFTGMQRFDLGPGSLIRSTFTVSLWLRGEPAPGFVTAFGGLIGPAGNDNSCGVLVGSDGNVLFETTTETSTREYLPPTTSVDVRDGAWHHIAVSWDGTTKRLFIDGSEGSTETTTAITMTEAMVVAADYENGTPINFYAGAIDELRIYGRALAATEVAQLATP